MGPPVRHAAVGRPGGEVMARTVKSLTRMAFSGTIIGYVDIGDVTARRSPKKSSFRDLFSAGRVSLQSEPETPLLFNFEDEGYESETTYRNRPDCLLRSDAASGLSRRGRDAATIESHLVPAVRGAGRAAAGPITGPADAAESRAERQSA